MRVLVTGGFGFLGTAVVSELWQAGESPVILSSRPNAKSELEGVDVVHADLSRADQTREAVAAARPDAVCHLAALTRVRDSFERPLRYFEVNTGGTINLLRALENTSNRVIVFVSTGAVYGPSEGVISETRPTLPTNPYGISKLAAEDLISYYANARGLTSTVLRCFNMSGAVAGVGDTDRTRIIPKALLVAAGRASHVDINGDGSVVREFVHIRDVARAVVSSCRRRQEGRVFTYNVGGGTTSSMLNIVETVRSVTGHAVPIQFHPPRNEPQTLTSRQ